MNKNTQDMLKELMECESFQEFHIENSEQMRDITLSEYLSALLEKKNLKKSEVIKNAQISEVYGYQIFSGIRKPERNKLLCLAFGMGLSFNETQELLKLSGYPLLYVKKEFDSIVAYGICKGLSIIEVNNLLFEYSFDTLG